MRSTLAAALFAAPFSFLFGQNPLEIELVPWAQGLGVGLDITHCGDERLFVARQYGAIFIITDSGQVAQTEFLEISARVLFNGERGLLGLAFDPDYATNGHFYVNYITGTGNGITRISRFTVSADPNVADPNSEVVLISLPQPNPIHQAGGLAFGPDGYLYCSLGDGGGANDPNNEGQDPTSLFGTILRIKPEADGSYSIPPDNPFATAQGDTLPEIWAYGLRNPYRFGIDPANGDLWIGDVGQELWEELNHWPGGLNTAPNFGWRCYEADSLFMPGECPDSTLLEFPVATHAHSLLGGPSCAIVGGEVYRGTRYPALVGRHLYTDFCSGELRSIRPDGLGGWQDELLLSTGMLGLSSIGTDSAGELYLTNVIDGFVHQIRDRCPMPDPVITFGDSGLVSTPGSSYQWYINGEPITDATGLTLVPLVNGIYRVEVEFENGCIRTSAPYFHLSTRVTAATEAPFTLHPQPADELLEINFTAPVPATVQLVLRDISGRLVHREGVEPGADRVTMSVVHVKSGIYLLQLSGPGVQGSQRVVVQH